MFFKKLKYKNYTLSQIAQLRQTLLLNSLPILHYFKILNKFIDLVSYNIEDCVFTLYCKHPSLWVKEKSPQLLCLFHLMMKEMLLILLVFIWALLPFNLYIWLFFSSLFIKYTYHIFSLSHSYLLFAQSSLTLETSNAHNLMPFKSSNKCHFFNGVLSGKTIPIPFLL